MVGNYICSYISLVPVVEVVLRKWASETEIESTKEGDFKMKVFSNNLVKYLKEKNAERTANLNFQNWVNNQINYFEFLIDRVFYLRFKDSEEGINREFNRNRALHLLDGVQDIEVLRDNVIRIFLLLDIIAELYLCQDDSLYAKNIFYADCEENINFNLRWKIYLKNALEAIDFTDMNIIRFVFLDKSDFSDENKKKFLEQKNYQIDLLNLRMNT